MVVNTCASKKSSRNSECTRASCNAASANGCQLAVAGQHVVNASICLTRLGDIKETRTKSSAEKLWHRFASSLLGLWFSSDASHTIAIFGGRTTAPAQHPLRTSHTQEKKNKCVHQHADTNTHGLRWHMLQKAKLIRFPTLPAIIRFHLSPSHTTRSRALVLHSVRDDGAHRVVVVVVDGTVSFCGK